MQADVDRVNRPEPAIGAEGSQKGAGRARGKRKIHRIAGAHALDGFDQFLRFRHIDAQRFFTKYRLARLCRGDGIMRMIFRRAGDVDEVQIGVGDQAFG